MTNQATDQTIQSLDMPDSNLKQVIKALMVSNKKVIGGEKGAEKTIHSALVDLYHHICTEPSQDQETASTSLAERPGSLSCLTEELIRAVTPLFQLLASPLALPSAKQLHDWVAYEHDFSGIVFYLTPGGKLSFNRLANSFEAPSAEAAQIDHRENLQAYSKARREKDSEQCRLLEEALEPAYRKGKVKQLFWIAGAPSKEHIKQFVAEHPSYGIEAYL